MSTWEYVSSKLGNVDPETRSIAKEVWSAAKAAGHDVWFLWGMGRAGTEHGTGNALDFMVRNEAGGDWVRNYIWANRARLRLRHVIWEQHITSTVKYPGVVRKMEDRGNTTANHYDHNHALFFEGTYQPPPAGGPAKPAPKPVPVPKPTPIRVRTLRRGLVGADVRQLQAELNRMYPGYPGPLLAKDGRFGPATERHVKEFQRRVGLVRDGRVGPKTRAAMKKRGLRLL